MADPAKVHIKLQALSSIDKNTLITRTQWGNIDFKAASQDIDSIFEVVALLRDLPLDRLPANAIEQIAGSLERANAIVERNNKFNLTDGNPSSIRDDIVNTLAIQQQDLYNTVHQWIPFLAYLKGDIPAQLNQITASVSVAKGAEDDFQKHLAAQRLEIDKVVEATRMASAKAGVGVFTEDFLSDADARETEAGVWLTRATWGLLLTLVAAMIFFFVTPVKDQFALIQFTTSKFVILAMLIGITAWCAGNYKANKHQATVSRHKAHALKTFQAFVAATENQAVKDAVLLETTRAIFAHNQTGFLKGDTSGDNPSRVVEIINSAGGNQ